MSLTEHPAESQSKTSPGAARARALDGRDASDPSAELQYVAGIKLWLVVLALSLALFVTMLDMSIVATAVPRITNQFHSLGDVGWYGSAYQLACAPMQPLSGKIYTYFKSKWAFLTFFAVFEIGSLICGMARSSAMLIAGRAVAGLGAAGLQNGALTVLAGLAPLARRAFLAGIILGVSQLGIVAGPLLGGVFTELASWRWCFFVNLPIGAVVATLILLIHIPEQTPKLQWRGQDRAQVRRQLRMVLLHRIDSVGLALFASATIMLLLALQWGGAVYAWSSSVVVGLLVGAAATGTVWSVWNYRIGEWTGTVDIPNKRGEAALVPIAILRQRIVWSGVATSLFLVGSILLHAYFIAIYFQAARGASPVMSGVDVLPQIISQLLAAVLSGFLISKMGFYLPWAVGGMAIASVGVGLLSTLSPTTTSGRWIGYQILAGAGRGMTFQTPFLAIQHAVTPSQIAVSIGLLSFGQNFGGAVLLTVANTIFDSSLRAELAQNVPSIDAEEIVRAGATAFRAVVPPDDVPGVVQSYTASIDRVFYLAAGLSVASFVCAFGLGWKDIRERPAAQPAPAEPKPGDEERGH